MRRIAAVGMMLILAGMQTGCFESVTEAPLEIPGDAIMAPQGLFARVGDGTVTIGWQAVESAQRYRVYRSVDTGDLFERLAETADTSCVDADVQNGRFYFYAVSSVDAKRLEGTRSVEIIASPAVYAISINAGATATRSISVILALTAPVTTAYMLISRDATGAGGEWESYERARSWTLDGSDGAKSVYARFRDQGGALSPVVSSSITLDRFAMIESIAISPVPRLYQPGATAHFRMRIEGNEPGGDAKISFENYSGSVDLYDNGMGGDATGGDGVYEADFVFPESIRGMDLAVAGSFVDVARNEAPPFECPDKISFTDPPPAVRLIGASDSSLTSITIRWEASSDAHFQSYRIYRSVSPGVTESASQFVRELFNAAQTSYPDGSLKEGTHYYYRIFAVNDLDETAGSNEVATHTFDAVPDPVVLDDPSSVGTNRLTLTWSVNGATDFREYRIYRSIQPGVTTVSTLVTTIADRERTYYDDTGLDLAGNDYYYRIYVYDAGGKNSRSNEVTTAL
ncbi:MAG: fibronectin type III domain-containing protein [Candidatus Krumholzibacteriia bacterium]